MINPYEPPRAGGQPGDPDRIVARTAPPKSVGHAVTCLIGCTTLAAFMTVGPWVGLWSPMANSSDGQNVLAVSLLALVTWKIGMGRRWAWWLNAALFLGGLVLTLAVFLLMPGAIRKSWQALPSFMIASGIVQFILQGLAFAFLVRADSRAWFWNHHPSPGTTQ